MMTNRSKLPLNTILITLINIVVLIINYFMLTSSASTITPRQAILSIGTSVPTASPTISIVVALQHISRGEIITPDKITMRDWPDRSAPVSSILDPELVIGKVARTDIPRESPITTTVITDNLSNLASVGSDASLSLPEGMVGITIHTEQRYIPVGLAIGDRINIFYSLQEESTDSDSFTTALLLENAFVLAMGETYTSSFFSDEFAPAPSYSPTRIPADTSDSGSQAIQLTLVTSNQDAAKLVWAERNQVPLNFVIQSVTTTSKAQVTPVMADSILR